MTKKNLLKTIILTIGLFVFLALTKSTSIFAGDQTLREDERNYVDLDGDGKVEIIRYETEYGYSSIYGDPYLLEVRLYINDRKVYSDSYREEEYSTYYYNVQVMDINPSDKYKEIKIELHDYYENDVTYRVFRYKSEKMQLLFSTWLEIVEKQRKNNKVLCITNIDCALGNPYILCEYKIKNEKLKMSLPKNGIVDVADTWYGNQYWLIANQKIKVYKKTSKKTTVMTLNKDDEFRITKIKFVKGKPSYAYIDTMDSANVGWIDISLKNGSNWWDMDLVLNPMAYD